MNNQQKGVRGETVVCKYLMSKDYKLLYSNWTCHWGELDFICSYNDELIIVEVKYRKSGAFGYPEEGLTKRKRRSLRRAINRFVYELNYEGPMRFDLICVAEGVNKFIIRHYISVPL